MRRVAVLLFDEVEVLDFAGPFEVFGVTGKRANQTPFEVFTVAEGDETISARNGLLITPTHSFASAPDPHVLVVPGGFGTRRQMNNSVVTEWVRQKAATAEVILSVCTGALILARAGLVAGLEITTHHGAFDLLEQTAPEAVVRRDKRFLDNGRIITSAGISAGIDAALHVVGKLLGSDVARETAEYMEYDWREGATLEAR
jgi:transcriptional regulator GlxA family with amidase domain